MSARCANASPAANPILRGLPTLHALPPALGTDDVNVELCERLKTAIVEHVPRWTLAPVVAAMEPDHLDAAHMLGVIKFQQGDLAEADRLLTAALRAKPKSPEVLSNHGLVLAALGVLGIYLFATAPEKLSDPGSAKGASAVPIETAFEIIAIDDGSTDGTRDWLSSRPEPIKKIYDEQRESMTSINPFRDMIDYLYTRHYYLRREEEE